MAHHDIIFDERVSFGSVGGPMFSTTVVVSNSGYEQRNINWDTPLIKWDISQIIENDAKRVYLLNFFRNRKGKGHTFLFKDWADYSCRNSAIIGYDEGTLSLISGTTHQLQKRYYDGTTESFRDIKRIKTSTFQLWNSGVEVNSSDYTLDSDTGQLTTAEVFTHWTGEFYFKVRFDFDDQELMMDHVVFGSWDGISIIEVRD